MRLNALDSLRGLIIVLMALDHASLFVAEQHWSEFWGTPLPDYPDALSLLTRVVSHLCAPGFFALMGAGMTLFAITRRDRGWSEGRIAKHFALRGAVLIVVDFFLVLPAFALGTLDAIFGENTALLPGMPGGGGGTPYFAPGVLSALGACMLVGGLLGRLGPASKALLGVALLLACQALLPGPETAATPYPFAAQLLLVAGHSGHAMILYPLLPWLGVTLLGMALGAALRSDPERAIRFALPAGAVALALFTALRIAGGFGTHHPLPSSDWMGLLNVTKYPPSLVYLLFTLGMNGVLLFALHRIDGSQARLSKVLRVYGRTPLFFYVAHLWVYCAMGFALPGHTSLLGMYPLWLLGVAVLYPACVKDEGFKRGRGEDSIWRLF